MKKENVMRKENPHRKSIVMSIRINNAMSEFMKANKYSPQLIFLEALNELGYKEKAQQSLTNLKKETFIYKVIPYYNKCIT